MVATRDWRAGDRRRGLGVQAGSWQGELGPAELAPSPAVPSAAPCCDINVARRPAPHSSHHGEAVLGQSVSQCAAVTRPQYVNVPD